MKSVPTNSWWRNRRDHRYAYRWMPYQVRTTAGARRASAIATAANRTPPTSDQDIRVGRDERQELVDHAGPVAQRIADGDEQAMAEEQPDRREPEPAMGDREAVHAEDLVEPRAA
jgi:hypothetical protein